MDRLRKVISSSWPRGSRLTKFSSNAIHCDLITERLGEYEKFRDEGIGESKFGQEKHEVTKDESSFNS